MITAVVVATMLTLCLVATKPLTNQAFAFAIEHHIVRSYEKLQNGVTYSCEVIQSSTYYGMEKEECKPIKTGAQQEQESQTAF